MAFHDDKHVIVEGIIVWDGIKTPEKGDDGRDKHSCKLVMLNPTEMQEINQIAQNELRDGPFRGNLPNGGIWPISQLQPNEYGGQFPNGAVINPKTWNGTPQIFDLNGNVLQPMAWGNQIYTGAKVKLLVHAFTYNNKQKGIGLGLDGVQIVDATMPKIQVGTGGVDAAKAFGGGSNQPPAQGQGQHQQPQGQQPPAQGQGQQPPAQGQGQQPPAQGQGQHQQQQQQQQFGQHQQQQQQQQFGQHQQQQFGQGQQPPAQGQGQHQQQPPAQGQGQIQPNYNFLNGPQ